MRLTGLLLCLCLVACEEKAAEPSRSDFEQRADAATKRFGRELQAALEGAIAEGGPEHAIGLCNHMAPQITSSHSVDGLRLRRVGVRVRNHETNVPTDAERAAMMKLTREAPTTVATLNGKRKFLRAIYVGSPLCLNCHGTNIKPKVKEKLDELYPEDEATGFFLGDLRGAFVVEEMQTWAAR